jgi:hypothetical protein
MQKEDNEKIFNYIKYLVLHKNRISPSYIQRKLKIGYSKAYLLSGQVCIDNSKIKYKYRRFISKYKKNKRFNSY